jgi:hypothetical protein
MFQEIWKDIRYQIRTGNIWTRVIVLCVIVFVIVNLLKSYFTFTNGGIPSEGISQYFRENKHLFLLVE